MTKIKIPFNAWSKKRLRDGTKSSTFRYKPYGTVGDTFEAEGRIWQLHTIIMNIPGKDVLAHHYVTEGAKSPEELRKVLNQICRGKFDGNKRGFLNFFRPVWTHEGLT